METIALTADTTTENLSNSAIGLNQLEQQFHHKMQNHTFALLVRIDTLMLPLANYSHSPSNS
jgi:uncharacterized membrane protein YsdA (DUF1294 family)